MNGFTHEEIQDAQLEARIEAQEQFEDEMRERHEEFFLGFARKRLTKKPGANSGLLTK